MQFISLCLFATLLGYSLIMAAPVQQTTPMTEEVKHQKAHAIANRLLKELAGEQQHQGEEAVSQPKEESPKKDEIQTEQKPAVEKVESHIQSENNDVYDDEDIDGAPTLEDLVELYGDKYTDLIEDEEPSSELFDEDEDEYILPVDTEELLRYLSEQEESDESPSVIHTPVMDDSIMTAEDYHRRRRSIY